MRFSRTRQDLQGKFQIIGTASERPDNEKWKHRHLVRGNPAGQKLTVFPNYNFFCLLDFSPVAAFLEKLTDSPYTPQDTGGLKRQEDLGGFSVSNLL